MPKLNITFDQNESGRFPVYCKYPQQHKAQDAYIFLDLEDGDCGADYSGAIGGGVPAREWHNIVIKFPLRPETPSSEIAKLLEHHKDDFQTILDGSEIVWDGNNHVGRLNEEAQEVYDRLYDHGTGFACDTEGGMIDDLNEWMDGNTYPEENQTLEDFAQYVLDTDGTNGMYFDDDLNNPGAMESALLELWAEDLYSGNDIPKHVAKMLLDAGACDDSEWMDELKEFAGINNDEMSDKEKFLKCAEIVADEAESNGKDWAKTWTHTFGNAVSKLAAEKYGLNAADDNSTFRKALSHHFYGDESRA